MLKGAYVCPNNMQLDVLTTEGLFGRLSNHVMPLVKGPGQF